MGHRLSWIGVRGKAPDKVLAELGLKPTGVGEEIPESPFTAALLPNEWYIVVSNESLLYPTDDILSNLSRGCDVITCTLSETVMFSEAAQWTNGVRFWHIIHDEEKSFNFDIVGNIPEAFHSIRDKLMKEQEQSDATKGKYQVDYAFDVPIDLAEAVTSFRHDKDILYLDEDTEHPFEILEAIAPPAKPLSFWQRLFGT